MEKINMSKLSELKAECIDSCVHGKTQEVTRRKTSCMQNQDCASNCPPRSKGIQTFCKETQTDASYLNHTSGGSVSSCSLNNSVVHQEKYMGQAFHCCPEFTTICCSDLDQNNNLVTADEEEHCHHPKASFTFDERSDRSNNAGTDMVCDVQTGYGSAESANVLKDSLNPYFYDLYELPVLLKGSDFNKESMSSKSSIENFPDHIVWTTWSYPTLNWNIPSHFPTDESLALNIYNFLQDNTDSWVVQLPHVILDGERKFLHGAECQSLGDEEPEEKFAENDIYFEDDYLCDYNLTDWDGVCDLTLDFHFFNTLNASQNMEEFIISSVRELSGNLPSQRKSCRRKHFSTSDIPCRKNLILTCCKETQTDVSYFDSPPERHMSFDPLLGLQIAFECSSMGSAICIEDSTRDSLILTEIST